jgi:hypothetical protein
MAQVLELSDVYNTKDDSVSNSSSRSNLERIYPISFPLHRAYWSDNDPLAPPRANSSLLPSSLSVRGFWCTTSRYRFSCQASTTVRYELQASAFDAANEPLTRTVHEILLFDAEDPPPQSPLPRGCTVAGSDDDAEFVTRRDGRLAALSRLLPRAWAMAVAAAAAGGDGGSGGGGGGSGARVVVDVREPEPVMLAARSGFTCATLPVALRVERAGGLAPFRLPRAMKVKSRIRSITYASVGAMGALPEKSGAQAKSVVATLNKFEERHVVQLALDSWRPRKPSINDGQWSLETVVLIPVTESALIAPTFYTPFVARRYSISLRIDIESSGAKRVTFRLNVPLQVAYLEAPVDCPCSENCAIDQIPCSDTQLPIYIP